MAKFTVNESHFIRVFFFLFFFIFPSAVFGQNESSSETQGLIDRISRSLIIIERNYYDPARILPDKMLKEGLNFLSNKIPELLIETPLDSGKIILSLGNKSQTLTYAPLQDIYAIRGPAQKIFSFIKDNYRGDVEWAEQEYAFIGGMLKTLDPHSNILSPKVFEEFKTQTSGEYGGIGIVIGIKDDELSVIAPLEGTPAGRLGLLTDDKIREIDHLPTINMPLSEAVERLRGEVNSNVVLLLSRKNKEPWEVTITREKISIISVKSKLIENEGKRIGVLSIRSFQEETFSEMEKALKAMTAGQTPLDGLVLDLRNNPGGLLDQSIEMADKFLSRGDIVYTVGAGNLQEEVTRAYPSISDLADIPLITLVSQGSASASEIVAGALKNNDRSIVMGAPTFGKGSVQSLFNLRDGSSIKLTIAQYLTPGRVSIQAVGIIPDVEVLPALLTTDVTDLVEDVTFGERDLEEHLENALLVKQGKPLYRLHHLEEAPPEEQSEYTLKIDESKDYLLSLAIKSVSVMKGSGKNILLPQILPLLAQESVGQEKLLTDALAKQKIDWGTSAQKMATPLLSISSTLTDAKTNQPITEIKAGDEAKWTLTVTNQGKSEMNRLLGVVEAEAALLANKEFVFGKIKPNATQKATVTIKVPEDMLTLTEETKIKFIAYQRPAISPIKVPINIIEKPRPDFAYSYSLKDNGAEGSSGNGNGRVEKGEKIALLFSIKNISANAAGDVLFNLKNLEGNEIYLREGRANTGELQGGATKTAKLIFEVGQKFDKTLVKLELNIMDKNTKSGLTDTLSFGIGGTPQPDPLQNTPQTAPSITLERFEVLPARDKVSILGVAHDDKSVLDVMIFVNGKKVFYQSQGNEPGQKRFEGLIPLDDGLNVIQIQARDDRKLTSRKNLTAVGREKKRSLSQTEIDTHWP